MLAIDGAAASSRTTRSENYDGSMVRFKAVAVNLSVLLLSLAILLAGLEAGLAAIKINMKSTTRWIPDKVGTRIPGAYYRHTKEGFSEGYFNSHGFRDYERTYEKPANTFRILVLGDSYVEALQVALENTFPALLEKALNENSPSLIFEVLSLGESGFGTADEYMRYLDFGVQYSPDLVLLAFTTGNDIRNNSKFLNRDNVAFYFGFDEKRQLVLDRTLFNEHQNGLTLSKRFFQSLKQNSYLASFISERLSLLNQQLREGHLEGRSGERRVASGKKPLDEYSDLNIYLSDLKPRWQEAFAITKELILKFRASVENGGARFVLVTICNAEQVHAHRAEELKQEYGLSFDYDQPDRMLEDFARQKGITFLNLMPVFREYHLNTGRTLHGFGPSQVGHWNENGHRLAAEEMIKFLLDKRLIPLASVLPIRSAGSAKVNPLHLYDPAK